jgi:hypothetical protein
MHCHRKHALEQQGASRQQRDAVMLLPLLLGVLFMTLS